MEKANVIQKAFYRSAAYLKRHSPTILTFVGATGVVATIIMSARATPKAMKLLEEAEVQKGEELDKLETIRTAASVYIPVAAIGIAGFANGISANTFLAEAKAAEMAAAAARAARRELDEHSPSKVGYEIGDFFGVAFVGAIGDYADKSYRAGAEMGSKARIGLTEAVSKISDYINSDIDAQPTIRPVLDLSNVQSGTRQINAMFSRTQAMSINANMSRAHTSGNQNGGFQDGSAATYNYFTQNNYSPKALSRVEIYRQTKNQFSAMKGTVSKR